LVQSHMIEKVEFVIQKLEKMKWKEIGREIIPHTNPQSPSRELNQESRPANLILVSRPVYEMSYPNELLDETLAELFALRSMIKAASFSEFFLSPTHSHHRGNDFSSLPFLPTPTPRRTSNCPEEEFPYRPLSITQLNSN
jgi:hypothetical protein